MMTSWIPTSRHSCEPRSRAWISTSMVPENSSDAGCFGMMIEGAIDGCQVSTGMVREWAVLSRLPFMKGVRDKFNDGWRVPGLIAENDVITGFPNVPRHPIKQLLASSMSMLEPVSNRGLGGVDKKGSLHGKPEGEGSRARTKEMISGF